jgi:hypothetical protein
MDGLLRILAIFFLTATVVRSDVLTIFETRGSAYERGFQHGQKFAAEIKRDFATKGGWGWSVPVHHRTPEAINHFLIKIRALPNGMELVDEMQGIADGAGVPFTDIAGLNLTFDLGDRTSCSMALIPDGPDGPILLNTLDDFAGGRGYPMFVQVAYPRSRRSTSSPPIVRSARGSTCRCSIAPAQVRFLNTHRLPSVYDQPKAPSRSTRPTTSRPTSTPPIRLISRSGTT